MRRRPSPAMVVALVALVVASAGSAAAASRLITDSSQVERGSINSGDLANGEGVNFADLTPKAKLRLRPKRGAQGPEGVRGPQGAAGGRGEQGPPGDNGADGSARAFAYVDAAGNLDTANSKGVNGASRPSNGHYCFDLGPGARSAVASVDSSSTGFFDTIYPGLPITTAGSNQIANNCPSNEPDAIVVVVDVLNGVFANRAFWVEFN